MPKEDKVLQIQNPQPIGSEIARQFMDATNTNENVQVLKELFDKNKLNMITELDQSEIALITRILGVAKVKSLSQWEDIAQIYTTLMISHKRKSRQEVVDSIKGMLSRRFNLLNPSTWSKEYR